MRYIVLGFVHKFQLNGQNSFHMSIDNVTAKLRCIHYLFFEICQWKYLILTIAIYVKM